EAEERERLSALGSEERAAARQEYEAFYEDYLNSLPEWKRDLMKYPSTLDLLDELDGLPRWDADFGELTSWLEANWLRIDQLRTARGHGTRVQVGPAADMTCGTLLSCYMNQGPRYFRAREAAEAVRKLMREFPDG